MFVMKLDIVCYGYLLHYAFLSFLVIFYLAFNNPPTYMLGMYLHIYIHMYLCTYVYANIHTYIYIHICVPMCLCTYLHTYLPMYIKTDIHIYICIPTYLHTWLCAYTTYLHIGKYTYVLTLWIHTCVLRYILRYIQV